MSGDKGMEKSSEAESSPPGTSVPPEVSRSVFLSYASHDADTANSICQYLESHGVSCWLAPRDAKPGAPYADAIVRAINEAKALVLVLSGHAVTSDHVAREVERAASKHKTVIGFRIDGAVLSPGLEYFLSNSQWIDVPALGMPAALVKLKEAVGQGPAQTGAAEAEFPGRTKRRRLAVVVAVGLGVGIAAISGVYLLAYRAPQPAATVAVADKSIAVLPFVDMSEKKDQEYFADGMAEEIIDLLARVPDLRVPARTSSFYFKGKATQVPDIARQLSVANVLEGSVRKSGDRLRVTAQLVRADTGYHLWSQTYDRDLSDVFKVQDDIANAVVQALQITLMGGPLTRQRGGTENLEAYQLYLRALSADIQNTKAALEAEQAYLDQAVKLDPNFGLAWSALALNVSVRTDDGIFPPKEGYERARRLAQHALQLSPDLADAHAALLYVHRTYDWNWPAAEDEGRQALSIDPTNSIALMFNGMLSATLGHWDDADRQLRAALARDPLNPYANSNRGDALYCAGRFVESEAMYRRVLELAPHFWWARSSLAQALLAEGKREEALAMVQQDEDEEDRLLMLPILLQANGRNAEADETLKKLIAKEKYPYWVAMTYAYRGDHDLALQWLDRAYEMRDANLVLIVGDPLFKNIANDLRYKAFLKKMNLPE